MSIAKRLNEIVAAQFKVPVESVRPDTDFHSDLEADTLDMPELAMEVEEAFDIMLDDGSVDALRTVRDLRDYVERRLEEKRLFSASAVAVCLLAAQARCDVPVAARHGGSHE